MQSQNLITKQTEVVRTTSTNKAAALLALGCTFFEAFHRKSGKMKAAIFRFFTEKRPPGTTGLVTYCFTKASSKFPKATTLDLLSEWRLAEKPHLRGGRGDAVEEFNKVRESLAAALRAGNLNNARKEFRNLETWLPAAIMVSMRAALENRDSLMAGLVLDFEKLPPTATVEKNEAGFPRFLGANLTPDLVEQLTNH